MTRISILLATACALIAAGCGAEAESAPDVAGRRVGGLPVQPWDTIAPEALYGATPVDNLRMTPVELDVLGLPRGWDGATIAVISDLHLDRWSGNSAVAEAAIAAAAASEADLIALLGDYLGDGIDPTPLRALLAPLRGRTVLAVLGDRDARSDSLAARIERSLEGAGVRVLRNEAVPLVIGGDTAFVGGVDGALGLEAVGEQRYLLSQIAPGAQIALLLAHDAVLAARAQVDRVSAAVAGGVSCAAVDVPGTPGLAWLNEEVLPDALADGTERLYRVGPMVLFVTCGVGYGFLPARFTPPPEVALVTLRSVIQSAEEPEAVDPEALLQQIEDSVSAEPPAEP